MTARDLHALLAHAADPRPDADLLRDPAGFPELVRRHGPLVWATCRRLSPEPADAFQAVFLALSRSVKRIHTPAALAGWLHAASVRVCLQQRRTVARRRLREKRAAKPEGHVPVADSAWDRILAAAHEEIDRLPPHERTAFVLCELQGVPAGVAAKQLGWKPGTLTGRLSKARARLLAQLSARGFAPVVGLTVAGGVPAEVLALAGPAATVPAGVLALSTEVTAMVGLKHLAACVLVAGGLMAGAGGMALRADGDPVPQPKPVVPKVDKPQSLPPDTPTLVPGASTHGRPQQWDHHIAQKPGTEHELRKLLSELGSDGWEFAGLVNVHTGKASEDVLVFKQPASGRATSMPSAVAANDDQTAIRRLQHTSAQVVATLLRQNRPAGARLAVTFDVASNQVFLSGSPFGVQSALLLLDQIDAKPGQTQTPPTPGPKPAPSTVGGFQAIPLKHARAADVARTVRELFASHTAGPMNGSVILGGVLAVSSDEQRNLVLYQLPHGGDPVRLEKEVRKLVAELDVPVK